MSTQDLAEHRSMHAGARPLAQVVLAMISAICVTLITNALDTSPTVSLIGATLAAAVPAMITSGGPHGAALAVGVTAAALGVTYLGFTAADAATDRAPTFPLSKELQERIEDPAPTVPAGEVEVPDVVGKQYADAEDTLEDAGLKVERKDHASSEQADTVVDQDPDAGTSVERGTAVTLSVSAGQGDVAVPDVIGQDETEARSKLEGLGLEVDVSPEVVSEPSQVGVVLMQFPAGETMAAPGARIALTVGTLPSTTTPTTTSP
jgi:PASTA domain